jgi:hypothetical protein
LSHPPLVGEKLEGNPLFVDKNISNVKPNGVSQSTMRKKIDREFKISIIAELKGGVDRRCKEPDKNLECERLVG